MKGILRLKQDTSAIIAFDCSDDLNIKKLREHLPNDPVEDSHITLAFIGDVTDISGGELQDALEEFAKTQAPVSGRFGGYALFEDQGDGIPLVLLYDSPQLPFLRSALRVQFGELIPEQDHGLIPHCTLTYLHQPWELELEPFDKVFDKISLWWGEEHYDYPLTGTFVQKQFPIGEEDKLKLIEVRVNIFNDDVGVLAEDMYTGSITIGAWEEKMKQYIRELHTSVAAIAKGGWDEMTWEDWGRLGPILKEQYAYLHNFAQYIAANRDTVSLPMIQVRAHMYGESAMQSFGKVSTPIPIEKQLPWMPREGQGVGMEKGQIANCRQNCCCAWVFEIVGHEKDFQIVEAVWTLSPAEHCETCIERDGHTVVLRVYKDIKVPDSIGFYCGK